MSEDLGAKYQWVNIPGNIPFSIPLHTVAHTVITDLNDLKKILTVLRPFNINPGDYARLRDAASLASSIFNFYIDKLNNPGVYHLSEADIFLLYAGAEDTLNTLNILATVHSLGSRALEQALRDLDMAALKFIQSVKALYMEISYGT